MNMRQSPCVCMDSHPGRRCPGLRTGNQSRLLSVRMWPQTLHFYETLTGADPPAVWLDFPLASKPGGSEWSFF